MSVVWRRGECNPLPSGWDGRSGITSPDRHPEEGPLAKDATPVPKTRNNRSPREGSEGFSLVELMVVVVIVAVLLAIGIPTFLGARNRADDRAAQASLRLALTAARAIQTDKQSYAEATENPATGLPKVEPSLTYAAPDTESSRDSVVSVKATATEWGGAVRSASGACFLIHDASNGTRYGTAAGGQACTGTEALTATGSSY